MVTRRIVCAHDLTYASEPALVLALKLARQLDARLTVLHATEPPYTRPNRLGAAAGFSATELELLTGIARRGEAAAVRVLQDELRERDGADAEVVVRQGLPVDVVCRAARELQAELLIVGTHARKGLQHALLGSVAERLVRSAPCPVVVARVDA